ncbi:MAG: hypothetical protein ACEQSF_04080 [Solirubrobacteraceae bacterium]
MKKIQVLTFVFLIISSLFISCEKKCCKESKECHKKEVKQEVTK